MTTTCRNGHPATPENTYTHRRPGQADHRYCRVCRREQAVKYITEGGMRASALRRKYGITLEQYDALLLKQNDGCAICGTPGGSPRNHNQPNLVVDHDHDTGAVRGLLCQSCNGGMGILGEDNLKAAIEYRDAGGWPS